jgi:hypothetical protein
MARACVIASHCVSVLTLVLLAGRLTMNSQQPAEDGGASLAFCATFEEILSRESPAHTSMPARPSPTKCPETRP